MSDRTNKGTVVLGIDPGLRVTGYGVVSIAGRSITLLEAGTIDSGTATGYLSRRLKVIHDGMKSVVDQYHPDGAAMEKLYSHYAHPQTSILMAHARGALALTLALESIDVIDYPATAVKASLTGNGHATKDQVSRAVVHALGISAPLEPEDASDALAIALCHAHRIIRLGRE